MSKRKQTFLITVKDWSPDIDPDSIQDMVAHYLPSAKVEAEPYEAWKAMALIVTTLAVVTTIFLASFAAIWWIL